MRECVTRARFYGLAAIGDWMAGTKKKYGHRMEPLEVVQRGGTSAVTMRLAGDFPGSPVTVQFVFTIAREDRIAGGQLLTPA